MKFPFAERKNYVNIKKNIIDETIYYYNIGRRISYVNLNYYNFKLNYLAFN